MVDAQPLVVFSHLRWDFVFQRPQHLMSRFARHRKVLYIEEPVSTDGAASWIRSVDDSGVIVLRPALPGPVHGFHADHLQAVRELLADLVRDEALDQCIAWLYTPMALPFAEALPCAALVYDCMDELSLFRGAPPELLEREAELLKKADLVFTGGPSLYQAKKDRHPDVHCFSSSVDADHFRRARPGGEAIEPVEQQSLRSPRLGFYGVIDERLDIPLLDAMATAHPEWQIIMVGPVVKIDPAVLPRHANLHYVGQRQYDELPGFLAGWDVCILPFALNDSTRFISPTKTLEYMAAERPIVSSPIRDVAEPYGEIVFLGRTPAEFISACERALAMEPSARETMVNRMREVVAHTSWERTTARMGALLDRVSQPRIPSRSRPEPVPVERAASLTPMSRI
jgi:glycosyltransferase involved in cell wall biosynthesis